MKNLENFPYILRNYLRNNNIQQEEFSKNIGVSVAQVNRWANGKSFPTAKTIDLIENSYPDLLQQTSNNTQTKQTEPRASQITVLVNAFEKQLAEKQSIIDRLLNIIDNQSNSLGKHKGNYTKPNAVVRSIGIVPQLKVA